MSNPTASRSSRLASYTALAGAAIPAAAASGAFVGEDNLNLIVSPFGDNPVAVDFGPGFGEIFQFSVFTTFTSGPVRGGASFQRTSEVVQFNNGNAGSWTAASLINYPKMGGGFTNDPARLALSHPVSSGQSWYGMTSGFGTLHDLAAQNFGYKGTSSIYGDWAPDARGFLGVRFTNDGTNFLHAWFDVEVFLEPFLGIPRSAGPFMVIHGWGLETTPNRPLPAGAPAPGPVGLALLAMGATGIRRSRRTEP